MKPLLLAAFSLFSITTIAQQLQPTETEALLQVQVVNEKSEPLAGEPITLVGTKSKKTFSGITKADGKFDILLPEGDKYKVKYKSFTEDEDFAELEIPSVPGMVNFEYTITVALPKVITLDNVQFDSGKSTLRPESSKELNELVDFMKLKKTMVIEIAGHTDNVGNPEANKKLSEARANEVKNYLIKKGVQAERVQAKGYGDTQPVASNDSDAGKQKNRRTEVRIVSE